MRRQEIRGRPSQIFRPGFFLRLLSVCLNWWGVFLVVFLLSGCSGSSLVSSGETVLQFQVKSLQRSTGPCEPHVMHCAHVSISSPELTTGDSALQQSVNQYVQGYIRQTLASYIPKAPTSAEQDVLIDSFLESYSNFIAEFPDSSQKWLIEIEGRVLDSPRGFITLRFDVHTYTGGAHFNDRSDYASFEVTGGKAIQVADIVADTERLDRQAESEFRRVREIPAGIRLDEAGFFGETNGQFELSVGNFGLTLEGMVFYYNPYEIASYAQGPTELLLPYAIIRPFLAIEVPDSSQAYEVEAATP